MTRHLLVAAAALCTLPATGQAQDDALKAHCAQLYAMADRALSRRSEGGGGPNLTVQGAYIDCQKGRYDQGIRTLEKELRGQGYTVPPPP